MVLTEIQIESSFYPNPGKKSNENTLRKNPRVQRHARREAVQSVVTVFLSEFSVLWSIAPPLIQPRKEVLVPILLTGAKKRTSFRSLQYPKPGKPRKEAPSPVAVLLTGRKSGLISPVYTAVTGRRWSRSRRRRRWSGSRAPRSR